MTCGDPAALVRWRVTANISAIDSIKATVYKDPLQAVRVMASRLSHFPGITPSHAVSQLPSFRSIGK